jgi:hypothetical protein
MSTVLSPSPSVALAPAPTSTVRQMVCVTEHKVIRIPAWVRDLASFRQWTHSDEFPEQIRICYLHGDVWVELPME